MKKADGYLLKRFTIFVFLLLIKKQMKKKMNLFAALFLAAISFESLAQSTTQGTHIKNEVRASAYPLIAIDPYTSAWSMTNNLYDGSVKHWTGKDFPLVGALRVDGVAYRFMGTEEIPLKTIIGMASSEDWVGSYTFEAPSKEWKSASFEAKKWKKGKGAFGTKDETNVKTLWETQEIWVRREITLNEDYSNQKLFLKYSHDNDAEIYINGIEVVNTGNDYKKNLIAEIPENVLKTLKKGKNIIAAHCKNRTGGALLDFGICAEVPVVKHLEKAATQRSVDVQATQTHYTFSCGKVDLELTFMAPLLMDNLNLISRPVNYISYSVKSNDGNAHDVSIYFEAAPNWAVDEPSQSSTSENFEKGNLAFVKTGSNSQNILGKRGDDVRIDWGYFYLSGEKNKVKSAIGDPFDLRNSFVKNGNVTGAAKQAKNANVALSESLGKVSQAKSGKIMLGYDDLYSIQYFGQNLRPYWNDKGDKTIVNAFEEANTEYANLTVACTKFDNKLMADARKSGGKEYAELCVLAYRQAISAHKLVKSPKGELLFLSKENFSNGSIGTVDITYPSAPLFLLYNPDLAKGLMNHIFDYSESGRWKKPFPAHDIGTYPLGNGQTYGEDMPVEEAGNMIILAGAIAIVEGNAKYAEQHWDVLTTWTDYLVEKGLDPENQLCTDDFAGHLAHNTNLAVKAIMGIASYGRLATMLGKKDVGEKYTQKAKEMAKSWEKMANEGDHYKLTFDKSNSWSQKYNLVWDKVFQLGIFDKAIFDKELKYYLTKQNEYGLPLDSRANYTKSDWIMWTATLSSDSATFEKFIKPIHKFVNETTDRVPMTDWFNTDSKKQVGFQARSVVGGYYIKMLEDQFKEKATQLP